MQGLMMLQESIEQERRPLSWVVGDQQVIKPDMPSQRDQLQAQRNLATELRDPLKRISKKPNTGLVITNPEA